LPRSALGPWRRMVESPATTGLATGRSSVFLWQDGNGDLATHPSARVQGREAWGQPGVIVSRTHMNATPSYGDGFAQNCVAIVPNDAKHLNAIWHFCQSDQYRSGVLALNRKLIKPTGVMDKVPFDLEWWMEAAAASSPLTGELPVSSDPTQWSFIF